MLPRAQLSAAALRRPSRLRQIVSLSLWVCSLTPSAPRIKARPRELPAMRPVSGMDSVSIRFFQQPVRIKRANTTPVRNEAMMTAWACVVKACELTISPWIQILTNFKTQTFSSVLFIWERTTSEIAISQATSADYVTIRHLRLSILFLLDFSIDLIKNKSPDPLVLPLFTGYPKIALVWVITSRSFRVS